MMKRRLINIFVGCMISICCKAQTEGYKYYATLDSITSAGFYKIKLNPLINAHLKTDYSDIRIVNNAGKWIPHALQVATLEHTNHATNIDLKFLVKENSKTNTLININTENLSLYNLNLKIRNTAAERYCILGGSDNGTNWFVVSDSILINPVASETKSINNFQFTFPLSNYKSYKLNIINSNKDPLEIIGITSYNQLLSSTLPHEIINNPLPTLIQKDSGKVSYIKIIQGQPYHLDGFKIKVSGVKYFSRKADLFIPTNSNHSFSNPGKWLQSFTIANNSNLNFQLPLINDSIFYLLIYNEDNLPLKVNEVSTTLNERYIKAYLEKNNAYQLIMNNEKAVPPNFDIANLDVGVKDSATIINVKGVTALPQTAIAIAKKTNNTWMIWAALIVGLFILLLLTKKMIKEVDKKTTNGTI